MSGRCFKVHPNTPFPDTRASFIGARCSAPSWGCRRSWKIHEVEFPRWQPFFFSFLFFPRDPSRADLCKYQVSVKMKLCGCMLSFWAAANNTDLFIKGVFTAHRHLRSIWLTVSSLQEVFLSAQQQELTDRLLLCPNPSLSVPPPNGSVCVLLLSSALDLFTP